MRTVVILASGPSLIQEDIDACRSYETIAINDTVDKAPWASICYAGDYRWWHAREGLPWFPGRKYAIRNTFPPDQYPDVERFRDGGSYGLSLDPRTLCTGGNSGYAAINLAVHLGAQIIVLVGYDMQPDATGRHHHHERAADHHPNYRACLLAFQTLVAPLTARGIVVWNATRSSALRCFPQQSLAASLR